MSYRMVMTLSSLLCNLTYRMYSLCALFQMDVGLKIFWIKLKERGLNNCCHARGCWVKWALIFSETPFFQRNLNLTKSKSMSHTLWNHGVATKTVCTCITYFVNVMFVKMTFTSLFLTTLVIIPNSLFLCTCPSKSKEKHCMGKVAI